MGWWPGPCPREWPGFAVLVSSSEAGCNNNPVSHTGGNLGPIYLTSCHSWSGSGASLVTCLSGRGQHPALLSTCSTKGGREGLVSSEPWAYALKTPAICCGGSGGWSLAAVSAVLIWAAIPGCGSAPASVREHLGPFVNRSTAVPGTRPLPISSMQTIPSRLPPSTLIPRVRTTSHTSGTTTEVHNYETPAGFITKREISFIIPSKTWQFPLLNKFYPCRYY